MSSRFDRRSGKPPRKGSSGSKRSGSENFSGVRGSSGSRGPYRSRRGDRDRESGEISGERGTGGRSFQRPSFGKNGVETSLSANRNNTDKRNNRRFDNQRVPIPSGDERRAKRSSLGVRSRYADRQLSSIRDPKLLPDSSPEVEMFGPTPPQDLIWGRHATQAALQTGRPIHRIWCTAELRSASKFLQLLREAKSSGVLVEEVTWARLGQLTGGAVHQGIALQTAAAETLDLPSLIKGCSALDESPLLLALDGLTDPQNLGAIVRSAEALGAHGLVLPQRRSAGLTGSVAKVAAGALEHLPVARVVNLNRSLETLKNSGFRVVGLAEEGDITLPELDIDGPLVVVTGSEDKGLSLLTRRHCDQLVRIPLRGMTPSLNASVATAMFLYELARRSWMKGLHGQAPSPRMVRPKCISESLVDSAGDSSELINNDLDLSHLDDQPLSTSTQSRNDSSDFSTDQNNTLLVDLDISQDSVDFERNIQL